MNKFGSFVQSFLSDYLKIECNYSPNTIKSYAITFSLLLNFYDLKYHIKSYEIKIEDIKKENILEFLQWLEEDKKNSISTRNQRLAVIKTFFKYLQVKEPTILKNINEIINIKTKKVPKKMITYFTEKEIKILFNYLNKNYDLKYLTMFIVLYETGARVSELINIKIEDLNLDNGPSIILHGKGNKVRIVPISITVANIIKKYLKQYNNDDYFFKSRLNQKYNRKTINYLLNKIMKELKIKYPDYFKGNYFPHSFRHSKATHLCENNIPLVTIKSFLGHASIQSTEIYTTPNIESQKKEIIKNASKFSNINQKYSKKKKQALDEWLDQMKR